MLAVERSTITSLPIPPKLLFDRIEFSALTGLSLRTVANLIGDGTSVFSLVQEMVFILTGTHMYFINLASCRTEQIIVLYS